MLLPPFCTTSYNKFLFDSVDDIKDNNDVMKNIFGNDEDLEVGDSILMANWKYWSNEED